MAGRTDSLLRKNDPDHDESDILIKSSWLYHVESLPAAQDDVSQGRLLKLCNFLEHIH